MDILIALVAGVTRDIEQPDLRVIDAKAELPSPNTDHDLLAPRASKDARLSSQTKGH
jgi:hypothetical protein